MTEQQDKTYRVAVLCGGKSSERTVSLASGEGARKALLEAGNEVVLIDPANPDDIKQLITEDFDVAFLALHGKGGEDGCIQGFLETIGLPYTGSGVASSATAMNKARSKMLYQTAGISTPLSVTLYKDKKYNLEEIIKQIGEKSVVKACCEGSTVGIYLVQESSELEQAINQAFEFDDEIIVEQYVSGREFTVAVIGNSETEALPVIEIVPQDGFYDYEAKYAPGGSKHICPAEIDDTLKQSMQESAKAAHKVLGCRGVSRTDFLVDANRKAWALETNTVPGMTETSLLPDAAKAQGYTFSELCMKLIGFALEKQSKEN